MKYIVISVLFQPFSGTNKLLLLTIVAASVVVAAVVICQRAFSQISSKRPQPMAGSGLQELNRLYWVNMDLVTKLHHSVATCTSEFSKTISRHGNLKNQIWEIANFASSRSEKMNWSVHKLIEFC